MANRKALEYIPEDTPYGFDQLMLILSRIIILLVCVALMVIG